jgi:hypothetical protein
VVAASVFILAVLLVYLGSHIRRAVSLPQDDLNAKSAARLGEEQIVIRSPDIAPGDLALSYVGGKSEVADIWLDKATLDVASRRLLFPGSVDSAPARISYTTGSPPRNSGPVPDDTCRTTIAIRRATDSAPVNSLKLFQTDGMAGAQRFRQVVLDAGASTLDIEVHTDSPIEGKMDLPGCHKLLTVGENAPIDLPAIPIHFLVSGGAIDLHFNPANPAVPIWTGQNETFEAVSLGDDNLRGAGLQIVSTQHSSAPRLEVLSLHANDMITFARLKLGADMLRLDIGRDTEKAFAYSSGSSLYNYDLVDEIQKNLILSSAIAALLLPALWKWIRKNCFPDAKE